MFAGRNRRAAALEIEAREVLLAGERLAWAKFLTAVGQRWVNLRRWSEARDATTEALEQAKGHEDSRLWLDTCTLLAQAERNLGRPERAEAALASVLDEGIVSAEAFALEAVLAAYGRGDGKEARRRLELTPDPSARPNG